MAWRRGKPLAALDVTSQWDLFRGFPSEVFTANKYSKDFLEEKSMEHLINSS